MAPLALLRRSMRSPLHVVSGFADPILERHSTPTLVLDGDARLLVANRAARLLLGEERGSVPLLARRMGEVFDCLHAHGPGGCGQADPCRNCLVRSAVREALSSGTVQRAEALLRRHGDDAEGGTWVLVSASPVEHEGHERVAVTLEDVTAVERLKQESEERSARFTSAERPRPCPPPSGRRSPSHPVDVIPRRTRASPWTARSDRPAAASQRASRRGRGPSSRLRRTTA